MIDFTRKKAPSDSMTYWATCAQQNIQSNGWNKRRSLPTKTYCPGRHSQTVLNKGDSIQLSTTQRIMKNIKSMIRRLEERPYLRHILDITPNIMKLLSSAGYKHVWTTLFFVSSWEVIFSLSLKKTGTCHPSRVPFCTSIQNRIKQITGKTYRFQTHSVLLA